ncbi:hypothetical protein DB32_001775 [Sandaracinus amylolyticus]|uniref:Uncharacterized protein n=1 Tax=Sandaracinus amylolyticus TaxID=927083 RepID=A0A0F6YGE8_9BACT|nr:hypothetical protein DB32_001775 [Sandaracinus amylolyticus]
MACDAAITRRSRDPSVRGEDHEGGALPDARRRPGEAVPS